MVKKLNVKFSRQGFVRDIKDEFGKRVRCIKVGKEKFTRNNVWNTYNSNKDNNLLHKTNKKKIKICKK